MNIAKKVAGVLILVLLLFFFTFVTAASEYPNMEAGALAIASVIICVGVVLVIGTFILALHWILD